MAKKERKWKKSIQRMLEIICNVLNTKNNGFDYRDIKITFTRALPTNQTEIADMVNKLNGLVSEETLLSQLDFVEDAKEEIDRKKKEQEEQMKSMGVYGMDAVNEESNKEDLNNE